MSDCKGSAQDIATLEEWATVFMSPSTLPSVIKYNIAHKKIKLSRDLLKARSEWNSETEYFEFGSTLGEMLVIATQPIPADSELYEMDF